LVKFWNKCKKTRAPEPSPFGWLVADGWCWFVLREEYCWLVSVDCFVVREKYCWLVADKLSEQGASRGPHEQVPPQVGVQIDYDVVHLRTSLVQLFVLLQLNFEEVVQIIELRGSEVHLTVTPLHP
jgi:hypothetical protein